MDGRIELGKYCMGKEGYLDDIFLHCSRAIRERTKAGPTPKMKKISKGCEPIIRKKLDEQMLNCFSNIGVATIDATKIVAPQIVTSETKEDIEIPKVEMVELEEKEELRENETIFGKVKKILRTWTNIIREKFLGREP